MTGRRGSRKSYHPDEALEILQQQAKALRDRRLGKQDIYFSPWLLEGSIGSDTWVTSLPGSSESYTHSFDRSLADGSNLLDKHNYLLLISIQKFAILLRNGDITNSHMTHKRWNAILLADINFASWVTLQRERFQPELYGFKLITLDDIKIFLKEFSQGGWTEALRCKERIIAHFHDKIDCPIPLEIILASRDALDQEFVDNVCDWLSENSLYSLNGYKPTCISRTYLNREIGLPGTAGNQNLTAFLRQFEPAIAGLHLTPSVHNGIPSHRAKKFSDNIAEHNGRPSERTFTETVCAISELFKAHVYLPETIPELDIDRNKIKKEFALSLTRGKHTPLIPLTIGMHALNQACRWVIEFGPAIVEATIFYTEAFLEIPSSATSRRDTIFKNTIDSWEYYDTGLAQHRPLTAALNITRLSHKSRYICTPQRTDMIRTLQAFIGACIVVIAILKPMRDREITKLPRNCLGLTSEGSEITHEQLKNGVFGINREITRAIPSIAARAIQLLQVLGNQTKRIFNDTSPHSDELFYFPLRGFTKPNQGIRHRISDCLDEFCNIIEIPLDKEGRRWYIRIHEMRKFFILISHRHGGDPLNQLLRRQAGQVDPSHLYSYIAPDAYDDDYVRYESECIDDKIIELECGNLDGSANQGLAALYHAACKSLGVTSISSVPPDQAVRILSEMRRDGRYTVVTYSVRLDTFDGRIETMDFAIKYGEIKDAKFYEE